MFACRGENSDPITSAHLRSMLIFVLTPVVNMLVMKSASVNSLCQLVVTLTLLCLLPSNSFLLRLKTVLMS